MRMKSPSHHALAMLTLGGLERHRIIRPASERARIATRGVTATPHGAGVQLRALERGAHDAVYGEISRLSPSRLVDGGTALPEKPST